MFMSNLFGEELFDEFFDELAKTGKKVARYATPASGIMKTDIKETSQGFDLLVDLPGYKKEDIQAHLKDGYLTIAAETKQDTEEKSEDGTYIKRERYVGSCSRRYYVGDYIEMQDIKAKFEDGVLNVYVPKKLPKPEAEEKTYITIDG